MTTRRKIGAVVLAAGRSVRFRSARSKLLHAFAGRPMIQWPLETLRAIGADPIIVVVGPGAQALKEACGPGVVFAAQSAPRGTGHAALAAQEALTGFNGATLIMNGDLPLLRAETLRRLVEAHRSAGAALSLLTATVENPTGWGRITRRNGSVTGIVEERDASAAQRARREVNVGVYCANPKAIVPILRALEPNNVQREIYLTDVVKHAVRAGLQVEGVDVDVREVGQINDREDLAGMEKMLRTEVNARWMRDGVTLEDPETTYIGPAVTIGGDTVIGPNVHLRGRTRVGKGCRLDGSAFLTDATLAANVHVRFGVVMTEARVGKGCVIGPFAHLRPGTRLRRDVHIGDFVETKNAVLGRGTKANHLSYLGDAEIGAETNIGAGTITCNYDGFRKYRTVIGDRVQVGSDTQLVAPVELGDDVYVASGTTVRRDVPAGALVFNPRQQTQRSGWVATRRAREGAASSEASTGTTERPRKAGPAARRTQATSKKAPGKKTGRSNRRAISRD